MTTEIKWTPNLSDLTGWVFKKKDGSIIRYSVDGYPQVKRVQSGVSGEARKVTAQPVRSLSTFCVHNPKKLFETDTFSLWIADAHGTKTVAEQKGAFDLIIDAGNVLTYQQKYPKLSNPLSSSVPNLVSGLTPFITTKPAAYLTPYLQIDWVDRAAPELAPAFWPALVKRLKGKVLVNCQGGHGRSGTMAVCIMMVCTTYDALDAITHLRAIHCPRAIESVVQHKYIDSVATYLGRTANATEAEKVKSFRDRFIALDHPTAKAYQSYLDLGKAEVDRDDEDDQQAYERMFV